jgi:hypothetical protein
MFLPANFPLDFPHLQEEPKRKNNHRFLGGPMKTKKTGIALQAFVLSAVFLLPSVAFAQHEGKGQWYAFGAAGGQTDVGGVQVGGGIGYERLLYKGLGLGGEFEGFGGNDARAILSANGSYHFRQSASQKLVPFGTAGLSGVGACGDGCGAAGAFNFGGGINYWRQPHRGFRLELRDYVFDDYRVVHKWEMRIGFTF